MTASPHMQLYGKQRQHCCSTDQHAAQRAAHTSGQAVTPGSSLLMRRLPVQKESWDSTELALVFMDMVLPLQDKAPEASRSMRPLGDCCTHDPRHSRQGAPCSCEG